MEINTNNNERCVVKWALNVSAKSVGPVQPAATAQVYLGPSFLPSVNFLFVKGHDIESHKSIKEIVRRKLFKIVKKSLINIDISTLR